MQYGNEKKEFFIEKKKKNLGELLIEAGFSSLSNIYI